MNVVLHKNLDVKKWGCFLIISHYQSLMHYDLAKRAFLHSQLFLCALAIWQLNSNCYKFKGVLFTIQIGLIEKIWEMLLNLLKYICSLKAQAQLIPSCKT